MLLGENFADRKHRHKINTNPYFDILPAPVKKISLSLHSRYQFVLDQKKIKFVHALLCRAFAISSNRLKNHHCNITSKAKIF